MKTLYLDIEKAPNLAYVWSLWKQTIPLNMLVEASSVIAVAWKWKGEKKVHFACDRDGHEAMLLQVHQALTEADVVVTYNGKAFDIPNLNWEFAQLGLKRPAPFAQLDLYREVRKQFKPASTKLDHVSQALGLEGKVQHAGFGLWVRCMANEASAWEEMRVYNVRDVTLLEDLHERLSSWLPGSPNAGLYVEGDEPVCPDCGSADLRKEGRAYYLTGAYQRYECRACGKWSQSTRRLVGVDIRGIS